jgi:hypothetical protein
MSEEMQSGNGENVSNIESGIEAVNDMLQTEPQHRVADAEDTKGVYLAQHQNTIVTGRGQVENRPEPLFKVGYGSRERPHKGAGTNVASWIVHHWFSRTNRDGV